MAEVNASFALLSEAQITAIDAASRRILAEVGMQVPSGEGECLERLERAGIELDDGNRRLLFSESCLQRLLDKAPQRFTLFSRDGNNDIELGSGEVHFTNGGRVIRILDLATGGFRQTMLRDIARTATLVDNLDNIRFYIIACQACDLEGDGAYHLNDFYQAFANTTKHVMGGCSSVDDLERVWQLAAVIADEEERLRSRPFFSIITNPISPLTFGAGTLPLLRFCAEQGIPVTCAPAPNAATTSPGTLAGTLVQMHAEALAGVAVTQAFGSGGKSLYGAVPTTMDLRKMHFSLGSVETAMLNSGAVQLARRYGLPIYGTAGGTEAKRPDIQAGAEKCLSNLLVSLAGADCIHLAAGMLDSANSISLEQYLIDDEIVGMVHRVLGGISLKDQALGLDVIREVGPGGHYVTHDHTVEHMMEEFFYPQLAVRSLFDVWEEDGRPDMLSNARVRVEEILAANEEGVLEPRVIVKLKEAFPDLIA